MIAFEVTATVHNGVLPVSPDLEGRQVRAIVLCDERQPEPGRAPNAALARLLDHPITCPGFVPLSREEANARP